MWIYYFACCLLTRNFDNILMQTKYFTIVGKTLSGLEESLISELQESGIHAEPLNRAVLFRGTTEILYRANYSSRLALRFLVQIAAFEVRTQQDLYEGITGLPWEDHFSADQTFIVDAVLSGSVFSNSLFAAQKAKDAIADRFRSHFGKRPSVDLENPDLRIHIHLAKEQCTVFLDSSGTSLHKRGYRRRQGEAPLSEVLAAGMIRLSGWDASTPFYDPMCGSGTLPVEAAMLASRTPAGFFRKEFALMKWRDFSDELWKRIRSETDSRIQSVTIPIIGSDKSRTAIEAARNNLRTTHLDPWIRFSVSNFHATKPPFGTGLMIMNPPYDERIRVDDVIAFHRSLGNTLKHLYTGWQAWIISADLNAMKFIGLKPFSGFTLFNGPLECRFAGYRLYEGRGIRKEKDKPFQSE